MCSSDLGAAQGRRACPPRHLRQGRRLPHRGPPRGEARRHLGRQDRHGSVRPPACASTRWPSAWATRTPTTFPASSGRWWASPPRSTRTASISTIRSELPPLPWKIIQEMGTLRIPFPGGPGYTGGKQRAQLCPFPDRKSTRLNSSHITRSRMPSSA